MCFSFSEMGGIKWVAATFFDDEHRADRNPPGAAASAHRPFCHDVGHDFNGGVVILLWFGVGLGDFGSGMACQWMLLCKN